MNKLRIQDTGFPVTTEIFEFMKNAYEFTADFLGKLISTSEPVIISGVTESGENVTAGLISYAGELLPFHASKKTDNVVIIEEVTKARYNTDINDSGQLQDLDTYFNRFAKCGDSGEGIDSFIYDEFVRIDALINISKHSKQASESLIGTVKLATQAQANSDDNDTEALTPKKLAARTATTSRRGVMKLATQAQIGEGTNDSTAVTPKKLAEAQKIHMSGVADLGVWEDNDFYRAVNIQITGLATTDYVVHLTMYSDNFNTSIGNHDNYIVLYRNKQVDRFEIVVVRNDDGGSSSGDPHIYVDWTVIKI